MADDVQALPTYAQLRTRNDAPPGSSWKLFGPDDERGMANLAGPPEVSAAAAGVRRGAVFNLDYSLSSFDPPVAKSRGSLEHRMTATHGEQRDDYLDNFWLQSSSQIDGLRHRRHHQHGFYNGAPDDAITPGTPVLGVNRWAENPIVGRGVLLDVARYREAQGRPIDHDAGERLPVSVLDETLEWQGVALRTGDCLLLRTGWASWYLGLDAARQEQVRDSRCWTGLVPDRSAIAWFWDNRVAMAASDTMAVEAMPPSGDAEFGGPNEAGMIHQDLIALLGLPIGELWNLDDLAADSEQHAEYTSLLVVKPLHLVGGVGSPANAVALR